MKLQGLFRHDQQGRGGYRRLPLPWGIKPGSRRAGCPPKYFQDKKGNAEDNAKDKLEDSARNGIGEDLRDDLREDSKKLKTIQKDSSR